jgi:hypothetical protein
MNGARVFPRAPLVYAAGPLNIRPHFPTPWKNAQPLPPVVRGHPPKAA